MRIPKPMAVVEWYVIHNFEHIFIATMMELQVTPGDACEDTSTMIRIVALSSLIKEAQRQSRNILFGMEEEGIIIEDPRKLTQTRTYICTYVCVHTAIAIIFQSRLSSRLQ